MERRGPANSITDADRATVERFLAVIRSEQGGRTPAEAFFVKCDSETTTQIDINNGIVNILAGARATEKTAAKGPQKDSN